MRFLAALVRGRACMFGVSFFKSVKTAPRPGAAARWFSCLKDSEFAADSPPLL
jgi:hypothetical protein